MRLQARQRQSPNKQAYSWTAASLELNETPMSDMEATYAVGMQALIGGVLVSSPIQTWFLAMTALPGVAD